MRSNMCVYLSPHQVQVHAKYKVDRHSTKEMLHSWGIFWFGVSLCLAPWPSEPFNFLPYIQALNLSDSLWVFSQEVKWSGGSRLVVGWWSGDGQVMLGDGQVMLGDDRVMVGWWLGVGRVMVGWWLGDVGWWLGDGRVMVRWLPVGGRLMVGWWSQMTTGTMWPFDTIDKWHLYN